MISSAACSARRPGPAYFDEVLEVIAEQSLRALDAGSLSISRSEPVDGVLRTLIDVGRLARNTYQLELHQHTDTAVLTALTPQLRVRAHYCTQFAAHQE